VSAPEGQLLLGSALSSALRAGKGSVVTVCWGGSCAELEVAGILSGSGLDPSAAVLIGGEGLAPFGDPPERVYLCRESAEVLARRAAGAASEALEGISSALAAAVLGLALFTSHASFRKALSSASEDLEAVLASGAPLGEARLAAALSLYALALASFSYGLVLGAVAAHASLWALRLFGVLIESRPLLPIEAGLELLLGYSAVGAAALALAAGGWRREAD